MIVASVFLVTVHDPICADSGDLEAALYGSFLPVPPTDFFPPVEVAEHARENAAGAIVTLPDKITINKGRKRVKLRVSNDGDRPIQVYFIFLCGDCLSHKIPRSARTTISSRRTKRWYLIVPKRMVNG